MGDQKEEFRNFVCKAFKVAVRYSWCFRRVGSKLFRAGAWSFSLCTCTFIGLQVTEELLLGLILVKGPQELPARGLQSRQGELSVHVGSETSNHARG